LPRTLASTGQPAPAPIPATARTLKAAKPASRKNIDERQAWGIDSLINRVERAMHEQPLHDATGDQVCNRSASSRALQLLRSMDIARKEVRGPGEFSSPTIAPERRPIFS
jgi:hypothetical protein